MAEASNQRVIALFPGALGDLLLALPALRALRQRHATSHFVVAVSGWLGALVGIAALGDEVASLDDAATAGLFGGTTLPRWLGERPHLYSWIGARDPAMRRRLEALGSSVAFSSVVRDEGPEHASAVYARQVGARADPSTLARAAHLDPPPSERAAAVLGSARRPLLAIHAGAGSRAKRWRHDGFASLAARWREAGDVVEIVGPAEQELPPLAGARRLDGWTLPDLAALLGGIDAYVGNDSGMSHLAAAVGARGVVVFVATRRERWAPLGSTLVALESHDDRDLARASASIWSALARDLDKVEGHD